MKSYLICTAVGLSLLGGVSFAEESSSVFIDNLSAENLRVVCTVLDGTSFYNYPELTHIFSFHAQSDNAEDEDIDIKNLGSDTLAMECEQENHPENHLTYHVDGDNESAVASGKFAYDADYPGAFTFSSDH